MCNVHGEHIEGGFGHSGFGENGHDEVQSVSALGDPVSPLDPVALTAILVCLLFIRQGFIFGRPAESGTREPDAMFPTESKVHPVAVSFIGKDDLGVKSEALPVSFHCLNQLRSFMEVIPRLILYKSKTIHHRKVYLLPKFKGRSRFPAYNAAHMRLTQTHDAIVTAVIPFVNHLFLLPVNLTNGA